MKSDLGKFITLVWMTIMVYFIYRMSIDLHYMTDLVHAYISMVVEHVRR